jgi:malonate transporter
MLEIFGVTGPIFLTIGAGYAAARAGLFSQDELRVFGRFVINLALPCLLFDAVARQQPSDLVNPTYLLGYAGGSLATLALGLYWGRRVAHQDPSGAAYMAMGMCCSNSGYVGFPILLLTLPAVAGSALALNMVVENFIMLPLVLALAERGHGPPGAWHDVVAQSLRRLAVNPLVIGLVIGLTFALMGWQLPAPAARTVTLFASASSVLSLFIIGGTLAAVTVTRGLGSRVAPIVVAKLLLHPLLVGGALWLAVAAGAPPLSPDLQRAAILLAGMPMMGIYTLLALRHGHERMAAAAMFGATVGAFVTLNAMLWALGLGG